MMNMWKVLVILIIIFILSVEYKHNKSIKIFNNLSMSNIGKATAIKLLKSLNLSEEFAKLIV